MKILIADDDPLMRELIMAYLRGYICSFYEAENNSQALAALAKGHVELILLDVVLHKDNGLDILRSFKASNQTLPPTIIMTGHTRREVVDEAIALGARGFLTKPFEPKNLLQRIEKVTALKKRKESQILAEAHDTTPKAIRALDQPKTLYLLETNETRRDTILNILSKTAWNVIHFSSIDEAQKHLQTTQADYLFINSNLHEGDLSSVELIEHVINTKRMKVIALSSSGDTEDLIRAQEMGISDFILEPVTYAKMEKVAQRLHASNQPNETDTV